MENKIVSTFMFSEPHEQDLLWLKFNLENTFVAEWVITESHYTFQGKRKPVYLKEILKQERFAPFRDKIHYIELEHNYNFDFEPDTIDFFKRKLKRFLNRYCGKEYSFVNYAECASFYSEISQRQACVNYITNKYKPNDIVLLCDTDECFDFDEYKKEYFKKLLTSHVTPFYIKREIFCYDYDNYTNRERYSPIIKVKDLSLKNATHKHRHPKKNERTIVETQVPLVFEYTFCFSKEAMAKKLSSFAHVTDLNQEDLEFCLSNNISFISKKTFHKNKVELYDKLVLDESNSPSFLRENFKMLKTSTVDESYLKNRKQNNI